MVAGIDAEIFRPDDELRRLARVAVDLQVDAHFREGPRSMKSCDRCARQASPAAAGSRNWQISRDPWFNINVGDGFYHYHRSWNDDLSMPFSALPGYVRSVLAGKPLDRQVERLLR